MSTRRSAPPPPAAARQAPTWPLALGLCLGGCGASSERASALHVFAAASTTEVLSLAVAGYAGELVPHFGPTSHLARQIEDGAPADLFVSASRAWIEYLDERGLLAEPALAFCRGELVCIAPLAPEGAPTAEPPRDLRELGSWLERGDRIGIASEGVPAGDYARQSLASAGLLAELAPRLVAQLDVRAVLRAVAAGELAAGFVYATDARAAGVRLLFPLAPESHAPVEYFVAILNDCADLGRARRFVAHLAGEEVQALLRAQGFLAPASAPTPAPAAASAASGG